VRTYQRDEKPESRPTDVKLTTERDHGDEMPVRWRPARRRRRCDTHATDAI